MIVTPLPIEEVGALLILAEREARAAAETRDKIKTGLVERMEAEKVDRIDLPEARVSFVGPGSTSAVDGDALKGKLRALGARLRALGEEDVDDEIPMTHGHRKASLRITAKLPPA
jgi:hypothetical protein